MLTDNSNKRTVISGFDLYKAIAATFIAFHHYQQMLSFRFSGMNFYGGRFNFGLFVELFFIISGFLACYTDKSDSRKNSCLKKLRHKLIRIYPYTAVICIIYLLIRSADALYMSDMKQLKALWDPFSLIANLLLVFRGYSFIHTVAINDKNWYLCVLVQCYLFFYLAEWISVKSSRIKRSYIYAALVVLSIPDLLLTEYTMATTCRGLLAFFLGVLLCELCMTAQEKSQEGKLLLAAAGAFVLSLIVFLAMKCKISYIPLLYTFFCLIVVFAYYLKDIRIKYVNTAGRISFSVYLLHPVIITLRGLVFKAAGIDYRPSVWSMLLFAVVVWVISALAYYLIERPVNAFFQRSDKI